MKSDDRVKVTLIYTVSPRIESADYEAWATKAVVPLSRAKGLIEARAYRNALKPSQVKIVTSWRSFLDWGRFTEGSAWKEIKDELSNSIATDIDVSVWRPSLLFSQLISSTEHRKERRK